MAKAYPETKFYGFDAHRASIEYAKNKARQEGILTTNKTSQINCCSCGKTIEEQSKMITEVLDGIRYTFDGADCVLLFKKFGSI